jgi:hypothetical protein
MNFMNFERTIEAGDLVAFHIDNNPQEIVQGVVKYPLVDGAYIRVQFGKGTVDLLPRSLVPMIETDVSNVMLYYDCEAYPVDGGRSWTCEHGSIIYHECTYRLAWDTYLAELEVLQHIEEDYANV